MVHFWLVVELLILLHVANATPVLARKVCGSRFARPIDGGVDFLDGRPWFGPSKTIRGALVAIVATAAASPLLGFEMTIGAVIGGTAMAGDLLSSFVKRRLGFPSSSRATGLDQIPESLFPLLACRGWLPLTSLDILIGVAAFAVGDIVLSRAFYHLGFRDHPY